MLRNSALFDRKINELVLNESAVCVLEQDIKPLLLAEGALLPENFSASKFDVVFIQIAFVAF